MKIKKFKPSIILVLMMMLCSQHIKSQHFLRIHLQDGQSIEVAIDEIEKITFDGLVHLSENLALLQNITGMKLHPNPASQYFTISYEIEEAGEVSFSLYDIQGKRLIFEAFGNKQAGEHKHRFNLTGLTAGTYICIIKCNQQLASKKIIIKP